MNRKIGIIDCDSFYVSVERVFNPISEGKPTIVLSNNDGCVIARSKESKELGIKMGEPFFKRRDFMEQHKFSVYSSNYNLYGDMSDRVMSVIKSFVNKLEVYSIDECFVDFSEIPDERLVDTLRLIRSEVKRQTGIPVSIGVGPNKTLAKLTSFIAKQSLTYDGVCSFWDIKNFNYELYNIDVEEVWGIGRKWTKKLNKIGVNTIGQFINLSDGLVRKMMNVNGLKTKMELVGEYCHPVKSVIKDKKNIASTRSFGQDINEFLQICEAMYSYIKSGVKKLKDNGLSTNKVTIFLSGNYHKGNKYSRYKQVTLTRQTTDQDEIWSQIYPYLKKIFKKNEFYKKCGILFNELRPINSIQGVLFKTDIQLVSPPVNSEKKWEMTQDFLTNKYTTSWNDIPLCFV